MSAMNTGAVALIDAMGFRGIWERHRPEEVLRTLKDTKDWLEHRIDEFSSRARMDCRVAFLSDAIAVSMTLDESIANRPAMSVIYLADVISWVLDKALRSSVPLAYRGAITVGEFEVSPHFLIGHAIDEAAYAYGLAQGALVWVMPAAREHVARWLEPQPHNTHLVRFNVPLKGGDVFDTYTVSPLEQAASETEANWLASKLLSTFSGSSVAVAVKRQNTMDHLDACYEWRKWKSPMKTFET
jgi:hypothetical protein